MDDFLLTEVRCQQFDENTSPRPPPLHLNHSRYQSRTRSALLVFIAIKKIVLILGLKLILASITSHKRNKQVTSSMARFACIHKRVREKDPDSASQNIDAVRGLLLLLRMNDYIITDHWLSEQDIGENRRRRTE